MAMQALESIGSCRVLAKNRTKKSSGNTSARLPTVWNGCESVAAIGKELLKRIQRFLPDKKTLESSLTRRIRMASICTRMNAALMVFKNGVSKMVKTRAFASFWRDMKQTGITSCWNMAGQYSAGRPAVLDTRKRRKQKRAKGFGFRRIALQCSTVYFEAYQ